MILALATLLTVLLQAPAVDDIETAAVRTAVQQYYDAQAQRDPERTLSFWSATANPRPTREAFLAVFGESAVDSFVVEVRRVEISAAQARVRVFAVRTRVIAREGGAVTQRASFLNAQIWRKESAGWKLVRDGPFADEIADDLIAASPSERPALFEQYRADLVQARLAVSQRATMAVTIGRDYVRGRTLFELALEVSRAADDRHGEANSLHNIAQAAYFLGDHGGAIDGYTRELAVAREIGDESAAAAALFGLATVAYSRAEYSPAMRLYSEALAIYEKRDEGAAAGRAIVSIGNVQYLQAEYDAAAASYRRALTVLAGAQDTQGATFARSGLARVFTAQGDLVAALDIYGRVVSDAREVFAADPRAKAGVAQPLESIGEIYYRLGNAEQARASFEEARKLSDADPVSQGRISASLGVTELVAGRFDAALAAYTESRTRFEAAKQADGVARAWVGIGFSLAAREKFTEALAAYNTAIRMFDEQKRPEDAARAWLGLSLAQSGLLDHEAALASARKVRATADAVKSADLAWRASVRSGEALRKLHRPAEARAEFTAAIAAIERIAAELPIDPDARGQLDDSADAWTGLAMTLAASGAASEALDAAEARRAHIRRVQLAPFHRDITRGMSPQEQADEQSLVRDIISTRAQLRAERGLRRPDSTRIERLDRELSALLERRATSQSALFEHVPGLRELRGLPAPPSLAAYPFASDGEVVVEYLVEEDELLVLTIARGEEGPHVTATLAPLNRRQFADEIAQALQPASLADADTWRTRSAPIVAAVLTPVAERLAGRDSVIIIPDDALWRVPFEALASGDAPLAARMRVRYATSLATLGRQQAIAAGRAKADSVTAAVLAAPLIPEAVRSQLSRAQTGWKPPDEDTAVARITAVAAAYGDAAVVRTRGDATEAAARAMLGTADVLHVAGPLQVSAATPLFSFLVLARSGDAPSADGRWEVREWFREEAAARTRVLVLADASSLGSAGAGGAMDAIAFAAAAAGVPALVVARWPQDGFSTDAVLTAFHSAVARGAPVEAAWAEAVNAARRPANRPADWAGARLIGAGR